MLRFTARKFDQPGMSCHDIGVNDKKNANMIKL